MTVIGRGPDGVGTPSELTLLLACLVHQRFVLLIESRPFHHLELPRHQRSFRT